MAKTKSKGTKSGTKSESGKYYYDLAKGTKAINRPKK